jgi:hypothetical protein
MTPQPKKPIAKNDIPAGAQFELVVDGKKFYLKPIPRHLLEQALGLIANPHAAPKYITAGELIFNVCCIQGKELLKGDEDLGTEVYLRCCELVERKTATIKKL